MNRMLAVLCACSALSVVGSAAENLAKPNLLLIVADDLGYSDVGCYGATKIKTPNIDRLASEGVRLTDAHAPAAVCQPTRYAILSSGTLSALALVFGKRKSRMSPFPFLFRSRFDSIHARENSVAGI